MNHGFIPLLGLVILGGIAALDGATAGFRTVTSDGARALAIERAAPAVPDVRLVDQNGASFSLADYRGRAVLVDFIYTRCPTLCVAAGDGFERVLSSRRGADRALDLVSISFDPANDDRAARRAYGDRYGARAPRWRIAAPADRAGLEALLKTFGVVVIPDGIGGFIHNGGIYVVDGGGHLTHVLDSDAAPRQIAAAVAP